MKTAPTSQPKPPLWLRLLLPVLLVVVWLAGAGIGGPYFGKIGEVASNDQAAFLPASADATLVGDRYTDFVGDEAVPGIVILTSEAQIDEATYAELSALVESLADIEGVAQVSPLIPSEDGLAAQAFVPIDASGDIGDTVAGIRGALADAAPEGIEHHVTGPAGFSSDLGEAFSGIDGLLLVVALAAVLVILLFVYRSVLLPFLVLGTSLFALCVALLVNWWLAKWGVVSINGQTQGILFILVIGAATDYALLYTARFSEELRRTESLVTATTRSIKGSLEPILASGGTVIAGLLCLLFSDLSSNKSLGPVAAIGIVFAMLSALTFLPSVLMLFGRAAFWPRRPVFDPERDTETAFRRGPYAAAGRFVAKRPRAVWVACIALLALGAAFVGTLRADGVATSDLVLGDSDARDGQVALAEHFPGGSGDPANILVDEADLQQVADVVLGIDGVDSLNVISADSPSGSAPVTGEGIQPLGPPGTPAPAPTVDDGQVLLQATLTAPGDSAEAAEVVREMREALDGTALIGGTTAVSIDTNDTSIRDRNLIIPIVLGVILLILVALLRSVLAPLLLVATTVLSFGTAMGVSALVFNNILDMPGADPSVPLYGFVFLVALGIDYNIFLMTRVREESLQHGTRQGILRGLAVTGGVITSAGIVLAATFAALAVIPILFLLQLAFIVAFGVLLDTFLVRTLLVPALGLDIGRKIWWPNRLPSDYESDEEEAAVDAAAVLDPDLAPESADVVDPEAAELVAEEDLRESVA